MLTVCKAFIMNSNRVVLSAILARAIGALVVAFAEERNVVQQMTPKAVQLRIEGEFPSLGGATEWLNSPSLTAAGLRGKVVLNRLLDLFLHQLAALTSLCSRLGRQI
jgi:hypothetical protein